MSKPNVSMLIKSAQKAFVKHSPEIFTGIGIAGMVTTTILAVRSTPKALRLLEEKKDELELETISELRPLEVVKATWKCYIPAAITCAASITCLIGASSVSLKRNAALATAYKLSETALSEYKDAVVKTVGEKKEQAVKDKVAEEKIKKDPVSKTEVIITDKGNTLCYEAVSGRYFKSDIEKIKRAENVLNKQLLTEMYISLNDFYDEVGLDYTNMGYDLGWKLDDGLIRIDFSSQIADDGTPCLVVDFATPPRYNYSNFV